AAFRAPLPRSREKRSLPAFYVPDQASLLGDLLVGQHVLLALVGIDAFLEEEPDRRADQLETLAEEVFQVALVALAERAQPIAVNHERRRIGAAGMGEAQLGDMAANHRRRIGFVG